MSASKRAFEAREAKDQRLLDLAGEMYDLLKSLKEFISDEPPVLPDYRNHLISEIQEIVAMVEGK